MPIRGLALLAPSWTSANVAGLTSTSWTHGCQRRPLNKPQPKKPMSESSDASTIPQKAPLCKHGEAGCGQYFDCWKCAREKRANAYKRLTPAQKAYDSMVDPMGAYHTDFPQGCSCHICAPCSYCESMSEEEADAYAKSFSLPNVQAMASADEKTPPKESTL